MSSVNIPNKLTILRIILGIIVPILMLYGGFYTRVLAAILFIIAGATDYLDGWYARKYNLVTKLGKMLDPIADKIIILGCFFVFSSLTHLDVFSYWWVIPIFLREVLVTIIRFVFLSKDDPVVIAASGSGKVKTTLQFVTLPVVYFIFMFRYYGNIQPTLWVQLILYIMLFVSVMFTLQTGWSFFSKNWKYLSR